MENLEQITGRIAQAVPRRCEGCDYAIFLARRLAQPVLEAQDTVEAAAEGLRKDVVTHCAGRPQALRPGDDDCRYGWVS